MQRLYFSAQAVLRLDPVLSLENNKGIYWKRISRRSSIILQASASLEALARSLGKEEWASASSTLGESGFQHFQARLHSCSLLPSVILSSYQGSDFDKGEFSGLFSLFCSSANLTIRSWASFRQFPSAAGDKALLNPCLKVPWGLTIGLGLIAGWHKPVIFFPRLSKKLLKARQTQSLSLSPYWSSTTGTARFSASSSTYTYRWVLVVVTMLLLHARGGRRPAYQQCVSILRML